VFLCLGFVDYEQVLWLRLVAGFGSGIFTSVAVVSLGGTTKPVRAFNMLLFGFAFSTALELHLLPKLSMSEIYLFFIGLNIVCILFLRWVPSRPLNAEELAPLFAVLEIADHICLEPLDESSNRGMVQSILAAHEPPLSQTFGAV